MKARNNSRPSGDPHLAGGEPDPATVTRQETTGPRQIIEQAARDIQRGLRDTELHGTSTNVPEPGADPEHTPGADVPNGARSPPVRHRRSG